MIVSEVSVFLPAFNDTMDGSDGAYHARILLVSDVINHKVAAAGYLWQNRGVRVGSHFILFGTAGAFHHYNLLYVYWGDW